MASSSEIEKLERRSAENPHGLTFAPLAEAYRKHGDLDRALEVLRTGRELHPDYIPASIVLGRCHLDRGDLAEAERSFAHVLTLDPENVIALKALADLAEREGRGVQAERWLNLLLAVDPSNDDARTQLDRIRSGEVAGAGTDDVAEAGPDTVAETVEAGLAAEIEAPADDHAVMAATHDDDSSDAPAEGADLGIMVEQEDEIVLMPAADSDYRAEVPGALPEATENQPDDTSDPFAGVPDDFDTAADGPDVFDIPSYASGAAEQDEAQARTIEAVEPDDAFDPADAAASGLEPVPNLTSELGSSDDVPMGGPELFVTQPEVDESEPAEPETLYPAVAEPDLPPVVTESMAELYLRQGHRTDALAIYRQLAERHPDDERFAKVVADLAAEVDDAPAGTRAYAAAHTGGRSIGEMLRDVLAERLPAPPPAPERFPENDEVPEFRTRDEVLGDAEDQGEPTRPADDHLTLGAVFGEDESGAAPPAVATPGAGPAHDDGLSFDEFFGAPPAVEPDATRTSPPAPSGDPDDLDQFHAWLQSLKR